MRKLRNRVVSLILIGSFNPKIFQPAWFAKEGLIREQEAEEAELGVVHRDVTVFDIKWVKLQVTRERFEARLRLEGRENELRDLVVSTFKLLRHTPVRALGVNMTAQFQVESEDEWHDIGHRLVPKETIWNDILKEPGTRSVQVQGVRCDGLSGYIVVRIEPTEKVERAVLVEINDHFNIGKVESSADEAIAVLEKQWGECMKRAENIITKVKEL